LQEPLDALVRVTHACICGSDLWPYREQGNWKTGARIGHEFMGVVEDIGRDVTRVRRGDRVIAPFVFSDGVCEFCAEDLPTSCLHGGVWGGKNDGGQGEAVRVPFADETLLVLPRHVDLADGALAAALATLTDVMGTGYHAAMMARVIEGGEVAIIGDGAVGLCAVLAARQLLASRIVVIGHHEGRLAIARRFGATDIVVGDQESQAANVRQLLPLGAMSVLECVGTQDSLAAAVRICRPGGSIGSVGVPHAASIDLRTLFRSNISLNAGVAPVRIYMSELTQLVLDGKLDPSPVLDMRISLDDVPEGYAAMNTRRAIKALITM
jgi:threonine dehydrogenase-like Zn-dependent dehydrogenase